MSNPRRTASLREMVIANFGLTIMVICWGAFFPLLERLMLTWDFYSVTAARQILGAAVLFLGVAAERRRVPLPCAPPWRRVLLLGFVGVAVSSLLTSLGVMASSGLSSAIISTTNPVSSTLTAAVIYRDRPAAGMVFGAALSVLGGFISVLGNSSTQLPDFRGGEVLIVIANITWTWMSIAAQRWLSGYSQLQITALTVAAGALWLIVLLPLASLSGLVTLHIELGVEQLWMLGFAGLLPIALGNFCWHYGVSRIGVTVASMYNNLLPVVAVAITVWLGGSFTWPQVLGATVILAGVITAQLIALRRGR